MQAELSKMRRIVDGRPNPKRSHVNNLLTGYCTAHNIEQEYMQLLSRVFYYRKHCSIFTNIKQYNSSYFNESIGNVVGVFKSDQYIIKYDNYSDLRQLTAYKKLGFGINRTTYSTVDTVNTVDTVDTVDTVTVDTANAPSTINSCHANIITPIWYCIYARNDEIVNGGDNVGDVEFSESTKSADPANNNAGDAKSAISINNLMTLEVQPKLHNSISFNKWYDAANISTCDHDYVITKIMLSIAKSIRFCHAKNIVHGDIKPDNFIVECGDRGDDRESENKVIRRNNVPNVFLIDFGLCGTDGTDDGTGGTRPFCAPETTNVKPTASARKSTAAGAASSENDYIWCKLSKSHDVWSFGLVLFTITSYRTIFHYYNHYPSNVFDKHGYVRDEVLTGDPTIGHPLYPVFMKTLCTPDKRASIDEIIELITAALVNM